MSASTTRIQPRKHQPEHWSAHLTPLNLALAAVPLAASVKLAGGSGVWVFVTAGLGIIPLAGYMGKATEALAGRLGPAAGGLLNATFGNAAELIIALMVLSRGPEMFPLVKATITGSVIGNLLLVLGLSIFAGGLRYPEQRFNRTNAGVGATLLAIACAGLIVPTLFFHLYGSRPTEAESHTLTNLSEEIAVVLVAVYGLSLLFTLRTHRHLLGGDDAAAGDELEPHWGVGRALGILLGATAAVAVLSEWLVGAVETAAHAFGMNDVFVGVIVVAVVGNAAEHSTAVLVARRNRMDLAVQVAVGSSIQVALFVAPVLVFASHLMGHPHPLDLHFTLLEVAAIVISVAVVTLVCHDGESNWLEGAMLLAVYLIFALAFYHVPAHPKHADLLQRHERRFLIGFRIEQPARGERAG
ncbi:calcium/proton exchanger [Fimbriiglobus ruber]|uniref:Ca(2+)/H(+) antiporter n=1 Tax=Fimbriiglobus ruber TaxID=1908690 RepID=A0A225D790_9BACT|nr:calcium/proton exchanger [Fimbriiglobus ruber]OWK35514.1 Calcium/proton antiporter [Fimbriiglobus ruber]